MYNSQDLVTALKDQILEFNLDDNLEIKNVVIDSRTKVENGLFIAIIGENNDGHDYLTSAKKNGCEVLLISNKDKLPKDTNYIVVKDSFSALYALAKFSRQRSNAKIIALTGSVGKTSVKELLKLTFAKYGKTYASPGNLNNHFGVPLSLCNFDKESEFGIFEIGMNHANEIEPLSKLLEPDVAIITNVGPVHIEFFENEEEIALAKSEIFLGLKKEGIGILNMDNSHYDFLQKKFYDLGFEKLVTFGENPKATYVLNNYKIHDINSSQVELKNFDKNISYNISSTKKVNIFNSIIAVAALDSLTKETNVDFSNFSEVAGRGKALTKNIDGKNILIIDDSYNASLPSIIEGLKYCLEIKNSLNKTRVVVAIGDMLELGSKSERLHAQIANSINELKIDFSILVGKEMTKTSQKLTANSFKTYPDSALARKDIKNLLQDRDILYVKGSRGMKMEEIINNL